MQRPQFLTLKDTDIRQFEIDHRDGETTVLKRRTMRYKWQIIAPKPLTADQSAVTALTRSPRIRRVGARGGR